MNDFSPNVTFYRPSGAASPAGILLTLVMGTIAGVVLACIYAFVNYHDPILYLNVLLVGLFGLAMGWVVSKGIHKYRIRNTIAAGFIALVVFIVAYGVHWVAYAAVAWADLDDMPYDFAYIFEVFKAFLLEPEALWGFVQDIYTHGLWTITSGSSKNGQSVNGVFLLGIWAAEALGILYYTLKSPLEETRKPYSERTEEWLTATEMPLPVAFIEDVDAFKAALGRNDYSALTTPLPPVAEGETADGQQGHAVVTLYSDPFEPCVSVHNVSVKVKKKKADTKTKEVVRYLKVSPSVAQNIASALGGNSTPGSQL